MSAWELHGESYSAHARFRALAVRAGTYLAGRSYDFMWVWLDALKQARGYLDTIRYTYDESGPNKISIERGIIANVCEASADHCHIREATALESERIAAEKEREENDPRNWSPLRQQWEAHKSIKELQSGPHEQIPEAFVREVLGRQYGLKPDDVTWDQIRHEVTGLFKRYPALTIIPSQPSVGPPLHGEEAERATEQAPVAHDTSEIGALEQAGDARDPIATDRAELLTAFKAKARAQGIKVTDTMVAKAANPGKWNDRTMVTWWKRNDSRIESIHDKKIRAVLAKNPLDLWSPTPKRQGK